MHGLGSFPVDFDDGETSWCVLDRVDVSDAEKDSDHECPLHDTVQSNGSDHAVWNTSPWAIDFIAYIMSDQLPPIFSI